MADALDLLAINLNKFGGGYHLYLSGGKHICERGHDADAERPNGFRFKAKADTPDEAIIMAIEMVEEEYEN